MTEPNQDSPPKAIKPKRGPGRPSKYSLELAERIAKEYAGGKSLQAIAAEPWAPDRATMHRWAREERGDFATILARARADRADTLAARGSAVLEELTEDRLVELDKVANAAVQLRKARSAYDQWWASRLAPAVYGDRTELTITGGLEIVGSLGGPLAQASARIAGQAPDALSPGEPIDAEWAETEPDEDA